MVKGYNGRGRDVLVWRKGFLHGSSKGKEGGKLWERTLAGVLV